MTTTLLSPTSEAVADAAVACRVLTKTYGTGPAAVVALDHVSVDFARGEFTAVMGASGSGKSTLLHCAAGLDRPTSGTVTIDGVDVTRLGDTALTKLRRDRVGFVFQSFNLVPTLSARDNIHLPLRLARRTVDPAWFNHVVEVLGLSDRLAHRPSELSGGQQQRVAVARALVAKPAVIFADEPTGALDSHASADLLEFLRTSVHELGQTIIMVTHDSGAAGYADRVVRLADGRIAADERN